LTPQAVSFFDVLAGNVGRIALEGHAGCSSRLIQVGAVRRARYSFVRGTRYRLGASLLGLGARVTPGRRPRAVARPPAELAAATGAATSLSATTGGNAVFLDMMDPRVALGFLPEPGSRVPTGTDPARVHTEIGCPTPMVDAGGVLAHIGCSR
jgi:hypothetical protein